MAECANGRETGADEAMAALSGKEVDELKALAQRLARGQESLQEMLEELEAERDELHKEKAQLNDTINLFMKDLQKLHIGSSNTVEPVLEEGPLDFVGRFWETVKPRDSAYLAGEHIGEIRRPGEKPEKPQNAPLAAAREALQQELPNSMAEVQEVGKQAVRKLSTAFEEARSSAWWQRAQGYLDEKRTEIAQKVSEVRVSAAQAAAMPPRDPRRPRKQAEPKIVAATSESSASAPNGPTPASEASTEAEVPAAAASPPEETAPLPVPEEKSPEKVEKVEKAEQSPVSPTTERQETILIEAQVKIGDGSVQPLHVRASDRCKDAAERFIGENSLKASFVKPLTDFLKKVERDADTFPVHVEVDLLELGPGH